MLYRRCAGLLLACGACGFPHGVLGNSGGPDDGNTQPDTSLIDAAMIDARMIDARPIDARPIDAAEYCYGSFEHVCFTTMPTGDYTLTALTNFDTDVDANCSKIVTG